MIFWVATGLVFAVSMCGKAEKVFKWFTLSLSIICEGLWMINLLKIIIYYILLTVLLSFLEENSQLNV